MESLQAMGVGNSIVLDLRAWVRILGLPLYKGFVAVALLSFPIGCHGQSPKNSIPAHESSPHSSTEQDFEPIALEIDRAVTILNQGIAGHWGDRDRYLSAFEMTPDVDSKGTPLEDAKSYVKCVIDRHFRLHEVWDEGVPIDAEARLTVIELQKLGKYKEKSSLPPCASSEHQKIVLSAGVAAALLRVKIDPVYPADALQHSISGTVKLYATIDTDGHVKAIKIVSGPDELRQAALNAVSQWIYKPYQLNGEPVEAEITVSVPFEVRQ